MFLPCADIIEKHKNVSSGDEDCVEEHFPLKTTHESLKESISIGLMSSINNSTDIDKILSFRTPTGDCVG